MMNKVISDYTKAIDQCSLDEAKELNKDLFIVLANQKTAPAIAANQIGINKKLIALNIREPLYLVNPKILTNNILIAYLEAHVSFPNKLYETMRYASILVSADNLSEPVHFGIRDKNKVYDKNGQLNLVAIQHPIIMESIYIQQCIDTLNGVLPSNYTSEKTKPIQSGKKYGRNQIINIISKDGELKNIKYKLALSYLNTGWKIIEN